MSHYSHKLWRALALALILGLGLVALGTLRVPAAHAAACTTECYVDASSGNDANDGDTPATAKKTIQAAVNQVSAGGTVYVAAGTYAESVNVNKSVTILGANAGVSPNDPITPLNPNAARGSESEVTVTGATRHSTSRRQTSQSTALNSATVR